MVSRHRQDGYAIVFVGAAAKAMTVLNAAQLQPDLVLDESPLKIGLHAPGSGIRIDPLSNAEQLTQPALFILSAWNFRHELTMKKLKAMRIPAESKFYLFSARSLSVTCFIANLQLDMRTVLCHFYNEEYLLPWWLKHHRSMFDHGALIDHGSTDNSLDICRQLVPEWRTCAAA